MPLTPKQTVIQPLLLMIIYPEKLDSNLILRLDNHKIQLTSHDYKQLLNIIKEEQKGLSSRFHHTSSVLLKQDYNLEPMREYQLDTYIAAKKRMSTSQAYVKEEYKLNASILSDIYEAIQKRKEALDIQSSKASCWARCFNSCQYDDEIDELYDLLKKENKTTYKLT